ncbi:hypothetical protein HPB51_005734 [Rhipicephalus microplus]|uniref:Uncharacterized protein n=1 Tax=Rhipicephalus microplus TaxID=6941 RepID=A0A9J6DZK2_RHIMP|nr:hypothetical protein HPB51_005734 [Rhipicephalus microplus]
MIQQSSVHKEQSSFGAESPLVQRRESTGGTTPLIPPSGRAHHSRILGMSDSNRLATDKAASNGTSQQLPLGVGSSSQTPLTPSARVSALNIVGDLLRKVGCCVFQCRGNENRGIASLDDIIETVRPDTAGTSDEEEMDDTAKASASVPKYTDVLCYVDNIRRFACARDEIGDLLPDVAALERKLMHRGWANSQKNITDFFKRLLSHTSGEAPSIQRRRAADSQASTLRFGLQLLKGLKVAHLKFICRRGFSTDSWYDCINLFGARTVVLLEIPEPEQGSNCIIYRLRRTPVTLVNKKHLLETWEAKLALEDLDQQRHLVARAKEAVKARGFLE